MKILDIALKDMLRSFRSAFLLVMMFIVPLAVTGLLYFAFGGMVKSEGNLALPVTRVQVANLDQPDPHGGLAAGQVMVDYMQGKDLARLVQVTVTSDEASARAAVERGESDIAVIIPANFSAAVERPEVKSAVTLYHDPVKTIGPRVVKILVGDFVDGFAGGKIAVEVATHQARAQGIELDPEEAEAIALRYVGWLQEAGHSNDGKSASPVAATRAPSTDVQTANPQTVFLGPVMAGMMIMFVFFTGAATAQSIIYEDEGGTLARLFTTPTSQPVILAGKFVAVLFTLVVQTIVLLVAASLLFKIRWGQPLAVVAAAFGLVIAASGFGVLLMSFVKTARQAGPVLGAVVALTGLLGGLVPTGDPSQPSPIASITLALPQGWAMRGWRLALSGASFNEVLLPVIVLLVAGAGFLVVGTLFFRKRFN